MSNNIIGTFQGIEYIDKISKGMINLSNTEPFEYIKNVTLSAYNLEKKNIKPILNNLLEKRPKDSKLKIEITGNSLKSNISFYLFDYSTSTLELKGEKLELVVFTWNSFQHGEFISSFGRPRENDLYTIRWFYIDTNLNKPINVKIDDIKPKNQSNKLLSDIEIIDILKKQKEMKRDEKISRKNRKDIILLIKIMAIILLFIIVMKFLK
jgi:hypothetical protein